MNPRAALLLGLAAAWLGTAQPGSAQGTIAYYRPDTPIVMFTRWFDEYYPLDMDGDASPELTFSYSFQFLGVRSEGVNRLLIRPSPPPNVGGPISPLPASSPIGSSSESDALQWYAGTELSLFQTLVHCVDSGCSGAFLGQHAYMGVEFERAGSTHYGWVLLNVAPDYPAGQIEAWAWEARPNTPIRAGAKPVPVPLASPEVVRPGCLRLKWASEIGKAYQVQAKARLDGLMWTNLNFAVPASSTNTMVDLPMSQAAEFFRVVEAD
jgi:hypothetical protein